MCSTSSQIEKLFTCYLLLFFLFYLFIAVILASCWCFTCYFCCYPSWLLLFFVFCCCTCCFCWLLLLSAFFLLLFFIAIFAISAYFNWSNFQSTKTCIRYLIHEERNCYICQKRPCSVAGNEERRGKEWRRKKRKRKRKQLGV